MSDTRLKLYGRKPKKNGWKEASARRGRPAPPLPNDPTQWEILLRGLHLPAEVAHNDKRVRDWVKRNYQRYFVPERVLDACHIPQEMRG